MGIMRSPLPCKNEVLLFREDMLCVISFLLTDSSKQKSSPTWLASHGHLYHTIGSAMHGKDTWKRSKGGAWGAGCTSGSYSGGSSKAGTERAPKVHLTATASLGKVKD